MPEREFWKNMTPKRFTALTRALERAEQEKAPERSLSDYLKGMM